MNCAILRQYFRKCNCNLNAPHTADILWSTFNVNKWPGDLIRSNLAFCDPLFILSLLQVSMSMG